MNERQWRRYFRQAKKQLACTPQEWKVFEAQQREAIQELETEQPDITFAQCVEILGSPEEAAREYEKLFTPQRLAEQTRKRRRKRACGIAAVVLLIALLAGLLIYFWYIKEFTVVEVNTTIVDLGDVPLEDIPDLTEKVMEGK